LANGAKSGVLLPDLGFSMPFSGFSSEYLGFLGIYSVSMI